MDFMPGTLVKLGVRFNTVNIDPPGSAVGSLDQVATEPVVTIPSAMLLGPHGEMLPGRRFMVFMIDIDVIQQDVATTVLHWFQPDLIMEASVQAPPTSIPVPAPPVEPPIIPPGVPPIDPPGVPPIDPPGAPPIVPGAPLGAPPTSTIGALLPANVPSAAPLEKAMATAAYLGLPPAIRLFKAPREDSITDQTLPANAPDGQASYFGPGPPPGPPHRYVQVLFAQPKNFSIPACYQNILTNPNAPNKSKMSRVGFDIMGFLKAAKVNPRPIAGNYFRASNPIPGSLSQNAVSTKLVDAMCPGETPMAMAKGLPLGRVRRFNA
ncbi:hypothetical protein E2P81_ATG01506 [Venturia nashicola]|uniref:PEBP-like protein n=1 Tax=Venturia nashicola TaxID=86259 RepID=A0A4Z1PMD7_9PEZI|nr:hypothetical protein E6O75_ATG01544 [Venturia nashicola]TLD38963.1 hypothetical protein E2P81_ATG01506 [Venturia nashicola]